MRWQSTFFGTSFLVAVAVAQLSPESENSISSTLNVSSEGAAIAPRGVCDWTPPDLCNVDKVVGQVLDYLGPGGGWLKSLFNSGATAQNAVIKMTKKCGKQLVAGKLPSAVSGIIDAIGLWEQQNAWDTVLCELFTQVSSNGAGALKAYGIDACKAPEESGSGEDPTFKECSAEYVHPGGITDIAKTLFQVVSGQGVSGGSSLTKNMAENYSACTTVGGDLSKCGSTAFIRSMCNGLCGTTTCMLKRYSATEEPACKSALTAECTALYEVSSTICKEFANKLPSAEATESLQGLSCSQECLRTGDASKLSTSVLVLVTMFSFAWTML